VAYTHNITSGWADAGLSVSKTNSYVGDNAPRLDVPIPDSSTDLLTPWSLERGNGIVMIFILSDQDMTLKTNSSGAPDDTIVLKANVPYIWTTDSYDAIQITADITALYMTNGSGEDASLRIESLVDVFA
jgi:hypothetical protein